LLNRWMQRIERRAASVIGGHHRDPNSGLGPVICESGKYALGPACSQRGYHEGQPHCLFLVGYLGSNGRSDTTMRRGCSPNRGFSRASTSGGCAPLFERRSSIAVSFAVSSELLSDVYVVKHHAQDSRMDPLEPTGSLLCKLL